MPSFCMISCYARATVLRVAVVWEANRPLCLGLETGDHRRRAGFLGRAGRGRIGAADGRATFMMN